MKTVRLQLPATSANLGPGFDTLALALELFLEIEAEAAATFSIECSGRNPEICGDLNNHLLLETYRSVLAAEHRTAVPLALRMKNGIPLGMGLGSSAAVRLAAVALAAHFGSLAWSSGRIVEVAAGLEGHPDNVAACWYGGFTVAGGLCHRAVMRAPAMASDRSHLPPLERSGPPSPVECRAEPLAEHAAPKSG